MSPAAAMFVGPMIVGALCALGVFICREILIEELSARLPQEEQVNLPRLNLQFFRLMQLHQQHFPRSQVRPIIKGLLFVMIACWITSVLVMFVSGK